MTELYHLIRWTYLPYTQEESSDLLGKLDYKVSGEISQCL